MTMATYIPSDTALTTKYPFAAIPTPDGAGWEIVFPDIPGVVGFSESWAGVGSEVELILAEWIEATTEEGLPIPAPSHDWQPVTRAPEDFRPPTLYATDDVAEMLGVSARRVHSLATTRGRGQRIGNSLVFTPEDVDAMRERKTGRPAKTSLAS